MRPRNDKDPFLRAQDFAAAIALTMFIFGLAVALVFARLSNFGCSP